MATPLTPAQLELRARLAANTRWARISQAERREHARRGQAGLLARFEAEVPASITDPAERARLAAQAHRAHMQRLALRSSRRRATSARGGAADGVAS